MAKARITFLVSLGVFSFMVLCAASAGEACQRCTFIVSAIPGPFWCTYTDCPGSAVCTDVWDHSYCNIFGSCTGTLPRWECILYPGAPCQDPPDMGLSQDDSSSSKEILSPIVPIDGPDPGAPAART